MGGAQHELCVYEAESEATGGESLAPRPTAQAVGLADLRVYLAPSFVVSHTDLG